jgi:hypothetical protein
VRRAFGPIVTTGVALVGAAVVVANPLVTKPHDLTVPSVRLSAGASAAHGLFDKALVDAIAVDPGDSASPVGVLKQVFTSLSADAGQLGGKAVSDDPAITPPPAQTTAAAPDDRGASASPGNISGLAALMQPVLPAPASTASQIGPELQQALTLVTADTGYVGRQVVQAAIAAAGLTVTEPALITQVVTALANGDVTGAVNTVIDAAKAPLRPPSMVLDSVRSVAGHHGVDLESDPALSAAASGTRHAPTEADPSGVTRSALKAADTQDAVDTGASVPAVAPNGATNLSDGNKVTPKTVAADPNRPHVAVRDQIRAALANLDAVVRKLTGQRPDDATTAGGDAAN